MSQGKHKNRTSVPTSGDAKAPGNGTAKPGERMPKSMVIRIGASEVGQSVSQLVKDVRLMMEPETASRLKERRNNKLRDYTTMAGPLGVSHLLLFSKSANGNTNLRIAVTPRGPTLHFRVESYSLSKDVQHSQRRPKSGGNEYLAAPLLVMNNFSSQSQPGDDGEAKQQQQQHMPKHLESLCTTIFQSLFPPINPVKTPLKGVKRMLLLDRTSGESPDSPATYTLNLRHYAIETRTAKSVPKPLRKLDAAEKLMHAGQKRKRNGFPNLGKLDDVADYLLDPHAADGFTSGSDSEPETDAEVEVLAPQTQRLPRRSRMRKEGTEDEPESRANVQKKGIKLHELGPRMKLRLTKVEEGLCTGKIMWHEYIHKSNKEQKELDRIHAERQAEKDRRIAEQKANVERKRADRQANGGSLENEEDEDDEDEFMSDDDWVAEQETDHNGFTRAPEEDRDEDMLDDENLRDG